MRNTYLTMLACGLLSGALNAANLDVEGAKQLLEAHWRQSKPDSFSDRKVIFQDVRITGSTGASTQVVVNALVWDYNAGYPANRYYGQTCISKFANETYTIKARSGTWEIDGAFSPKEYAQCKNNPSAGVSAVPPNSLPGTQAGRATTVAPPTMARSGGAGLGPYECWSFSRAQMLLNLTIKPGNQYVDSAGKSGTFSIDSSNGRMSFRGGLWDGGLPAGAYAVYWEDKGRPTISIRNAKGDESAFCQAK